MFPFAPNAPWLAPLAGFSDLPFRLLCRENGAAVCCTEMISAKGVVYGNDGDLLATCPADLPLVVQIFGSEPAFMEEGTRRIMARGFEYFDVNMGCSVPKVTKTFSGSALLKNPALALDVARAVIRAAGAGKVGFKLRLGWAGDPAAPFPFEPYYNLALALADLGAAWITLHPRYALQLFKGTPKHEALVRLATALPVPLIASGDLFTAEDGVNIIQDSGVATVMYARGALHDPTIFARHRALLAGSPLPPATPARLLALIRRHAELAQAHAPARSLLKMRTVVPRYLRLAPGSRALRTALNTCTTWNSFYDLLANWECSGFGNGQAHE